MIRYTTHNFKMVIATLCVVLSIAACNQNNGNSSTGDSAPSGTEPGSGGEAFQHAVITDTLAYGEVNEQNVKGYFAFPEEKMGASPAIILIHEWWGLNDDMRLLANQFAAEGFIVLAVDLFGGNTATGPGEARKLMLDVFEHPEFAEENLQKARDWVLEVAGASQVAVVGYGFGGGWSLNAAIALPDQFDAAVIYYGLVTDNEEVLENIELPVLGFFGGADNTIPVESVRTFDAALENLGKDHEINIYPSAKGGFANPNGRNYYQNLAEISWQRTMEFLDLNLQVTKVEND
jgi:carboxymethylenebutenolidase